MSVSPYTKYEYIAFYDLDHTILSGNSATHLAEEARNRGVMSPKQYRHALYLSILYKLGVGDPSRMIIRMLSWLRGLSEPMVHQLCQEVFQEDLEKIIRPEILDSLEMHRKGKGANVLLSSATSPVCGPISEHLHLDDMICTYLETEDGKFTGRIDGTLVFGPEKKNRMLSYCAQYGHDPREAYYYGDSIADQYVMDAVGFPVAVSPDRKLLKIARRKEWPVLVNDR